jgi:hypothetical protein
MVSSKIHIEAGEKLGAALTNDNASGRHGLTTIGLYAQILGIAITAVT